MNLQLKRKQFGTTTLITTLIALGGFLSACGGSPYYAPNGSGLYQPNPQSGSSSGTNPSNHSYTPPNTDPNKKPDCGGQNCTKPIQNNFNLLENPNEGTINKITTSSKLRLLLKVNSYVTAIDQQTNKAAGNYSIYCATVDVKIGTNTYTAYIDAVSNGCQLAGKTSASRLNLDSDISQFDEPADIKLSNGWVFYQGRGMIYGWHSLVDSSDVKDKLEGNYCIEINGSMSCQ